MSRKHKKAPAAAAAAKRPAPTTPKKRPPRLKDLFSVLFRRPRDRRACDEKAPKPITEQTGHDADNE